MLKANLESTSVDRALEFDMSGWLNVSADSSEPDTGLRDARINSTYASDRPRSLDSFLLPSRTAAPEAIIASAANRCGAVLAPRLARLVAAEIEGTGELADCLFSPLSTAQARNRRAVGAAVGDREGRE